MHKLSCVVFAAMCLCTPAIAQSVLFDFENAQIGSSLPLNLTVDGIMASLSATGLGGFYIQQPQNTILYTPKGFSGNCIVPKSILAADLHVGFSQMLTDFSIVYAPHELDCDSSATMRVTAYRNGAFVGTNTAVADPPGTWPSATLSYNSAQGFNSVVVHYDSPPPTGGDYGTIFVADNMSATPVPGPSTLVWSGSVSGVWDVNTTANFSGSPSGKFNDGDHVTFDDSGSNPAIMIAAGGVVPGSIVFSNTAATDYSLSGGAVKGATSLAVSGGGRVTLNSVNTYTGGTIVTAGTLIVGNAGALPAGQSLIIGTGGTVVLGSGLSASGASAVPEPSTLALLGIGALGLLGLAWQRRKRSMNGSARAVFGWPFSLGGSGCRHG